MPFRNQNCPPDTLSMMYRVLDECVAIMLEGSQFPSDPAKLQGIRDRFVRIILGAVADGELDPEALKQIVLDGFRGTT